MIGPAAPGPVGVVFDCDGVLADTMPCWEEAFSRVARQFGVTLGQRRLAGLRGAALGTAARRMARWSRPALAPEELLAALREQLLASLDGADLGLIEGVRELLGNLYGLVHLGVASNSPRSILLRLLARLEITEFFAVAISAEDVVRPKPAPDPYLSACSALQVYPELSFAIEDSEIGVRSASAAGLTVIELTGSPSPGPGEAGRAAAALQVGSLTDPRILALILGSPPPDPPTPIPSGLAHPTTHPLRGRITP